MRARDDKIVANFLKFLENKPLVGFLLTMFEQTRRAMWQWNCVKRETVWRLRLPDGTERKVEEFRGADGACRRFSERSTSRNSNIHSHWLTIKKKIATISVQRNSKNKRRHISETKSSSSTNRINVRKEGEMETTPALTWTQRDSRFWFISAKRERRLTSLAQCARLRK